jgi:hypothetical protein
MSILGSIRELSRSNLKISIYERVEPDGKERPNAFVSAV